MTRPIDSKSLDELIRLQTFYKERADNGRNADDRRHNQRAYDRITREINERLQAGESTASGQVAQAQASQAKLNQAFANDTIRRQSTAASLAPAANPTNTQSSWQNAAIPVLALLALWWLLRRG